MRHTAGREMWVKYTLRLTGGQRAETEAVAKNREILPGEKYFKYGISGTKFQDRVVKSYLLNLSA